MDSQELPKTVNTRSENHSEPEKARIGQIKFIGHELLKIFMSPSFTPSDALNPYRDLDMLIDNFGSKEELEGFISSYAKSVYRIVKVFLEDDAGILEIPTSVEIPFYEERKRIRTFKKINDNVERIAKRANRSFENNDYRPLVIIGYKDDTYEDTDKVFDKEVLDAGNVTVLYLNGKGNVMKRLGGIKAKQVIVDTDTSSDKYSIYAGNLDSIECEALAVTSRGEVDETNLNVKDAILLDGGRILPKTGSVNVKTILQTGGIMAIPNITTVSYIQRGGENKSSTTTCTSNYTLEEGAILACRQLLLTELSALNNKGGTVREFVQQMFLHDRHEAVAENIYLEYGRELVKFFFPDDNEDWSEMQSLLTRWFNDFIVSKNIPIGFYEKYQNILTGQHASKQTVRANDVYNVRFAHIANIIAFFYLTNTPIYDANPEMLVNISSYKDFKQKMNSIHSGDRRLIMITDLPRNEFPGKYEFRGRWDFGSATFYKGSEDYGGELMWHARSIRADTIIINSYYDTRLELGMDSWITHELSWNVYTKNLGVMRRGTLHPKGKILCEDTILQYGNIEAVKIIRGFKKAGVKRHIQENGENEAKYEKCQSYVINDGVLNVIKLDADIFEMNGGVINPKDPKNIRDTGRREIYARDVKINGGELRDVTITSSEVILIDNSVIEGTVIIKCKRDQIKQGSNLKINGQLKFEYID